MAFLTNTLSDLDTNSVGSLTIGIDITGQKLISWVVAPKTGTHLNHRIGLQISFDNTNWVSANSRLQGDKVFSTKEIAAGYIRFRVSKAEGATSTVDIIVNAK